MIEWWSALSALWGVVSIGLLVYVLYRFAEDIIVVMEDFEDDDNT